jgi:RNA 2',3'-cyclic 3'-phosphodiesterase
MKRTRTFIAVEASSELRAQAGQLVSRLRPVFSDVKWVATQNLHWTLQFLGDVDDLEIPEVCRAVAAAATELEVFSLCAAGVGVFPAPNRPRILWIGAEQGNEQLVELQGEIDRRLGKLGYRGENRRFVPHLTVGRFGRSSQSADISAELESVADLVACEMPVEEVIVFASRLAKGGSVYEPLCRSPLAM